MTSAENKAIVLRYYEATHNQRDLSVIDELCEREYGEGRRRFFEMAYAAMPDFRSTVEDAIAEGDKVVIQETVRGTLRGEFPTRVGVVPPTGKEISAGSILIYRVENGKIVAEQGQVDLLGLLLQAGATVQLPRPAVS